LLIQLCTFPQILRSCRLSVGEDLSPVSPSYQESVGSFSWEAPSHVESRYLVVLAFEALVRVRFFCTCIKSAPLACGCSIPSRSPIVQLTVIPVVSLFWQLSDLSSRRTLLLIFVRGPLVVCWQPWQVCEGGRPLLTCCALNSVSERVVGERFLALV